MRDNEKLREKAAQDLAEAARGLLYMSDIKHPDGFTLGRPDIFRI